MLQFIDHFFTVFHLGFIGFVLFGWISPKGRRAHSLAILLTLFAWLMLGLYKGVIGYCPLTDWQWDIKRALGETGMPSSFVEYVIEKSTGVDFPTKLVDWITAMGLVFGVSMSAFFHIRSFSPKEPEIA